MSRFLTGIALLMPTFSLPHAPPEVALPASPLCGTLPYRPPEGDPLASAPCLSPVTLSAPDHSTSELLRTLSMMAASGPTSWLSLRPDFLSH